MGNAMFHCMLRPILTVRLIVPNGEVLEFDKQVMAKQLMKLYHGHLVAHCSRLSRTEGGGLSLGLRGARVTLLRPEKMLMLGQTYCLLRVPNSGTSLQQGSNSKSLPGNGKSVQRQICGRELKRMTLRGLIYGTVSDVCVYEREIVGELQRHFAHAIQLTLSPTSAPAAAAFKLAKDSNPSRLLARPERHAHAIPPSTRTWRPQLDSIMESPLNIDNSPSGPQSIMLTSDVNQTRHDLVASSREGEEAVGTH